MKNKKGTILIAMGLLLVAAALFLTAWNLYEHSRAAQSVSEVMEQMEAAFPAVAAAGREAEADEREKRPERPQESLWDEPGGTEEVEIPDHILNPQMEMPKAKIAEQEYIGVLKIPALRLELPVISSWSYPRLRIAPCRYAGSAYTNDLVIAAHNYPSHFGKLKQLQEGEEVIFTDMDGNVFLYEAVLWETL